MQSVNTVEELQGPYGPVVISEEILHRIWAHQDFSRDNLRTRTGQALEIRFPGAWNRAGGPDFRHARIAISGQVLEGDIEIHFREREWHDHRHDTNPEFANVILHVVLFPTWDQAPSPPPDSGYVPPECLVWLPYLDRDLETYAEEVAYSMLGSHVEQAVLDTLSKLPPPERRTRVAEAASKRWPRKVARAATVLEETRSWSEACHRLVLEGLGLSANRAPMLRTARRYPLPQWIQEDPEHLVSGALEAEDGWRTQGIRPSNQPGRRLRSYAEICRSHRDWPGALLAILDALNPPPTPPLDTVRFRKESQMGAYRDRIAEGVFMGRIGTKRVDTLVADYLLPLAQSHRQRDFSAFAFHWQPGDISAAIDRLIRVAGITVRREIPGCNGWNQGVLQILAEQATAESERFC